MGRPLQFFAFGLLILTAAARAAAQSHGKEPDLAKPGVVAREAAAPAARVQAQAGAQSHGKEPVPAKPEVAHAAPALAAKSRAVVQPRGQEPVPARPDDAQEAPAPAATARAIAKALADARARRKETLGAQRSVPKVPAEKRLLVVWPQPDQRVRLTWPEQRVALMWPTADGVR